MMERKQNEQVVKAKEEKGEGLLEILKDLDGQEFIVIVPIMGEEDKYEHSKSV